MTVKEYLILEHKINKGNTKVPQVKEKSVTVTGGGKNVRLNIKPISVNKCYNGQRTKSKAYYEYEKEMLLSLPASYPIDSEELEIYYEFGVSSKGGDVDNLVKCCQDCICKKYHINDNRIYEITARKVIVPKGEEYIKFEIKTLTKKAQ